MKKLEFYACEICGAQYLEKEACKRCETKHVREMRIVGSRYLPISQDNSGMPITITLLGADGAHYTYKR